MKIRTTKRLAALGAVPVAALGLGLAACGSQAATAPPQVRIVHVTAPPKVVHVTTPAKPVPAKTVYVTPPPATPAAPASPPVAQPAPAGPPPQIVNAEAVVSQYYQDITDQNYQAAWALGGDNLNGGVGYSQWVAGYATTASISLGTFSSFGSDQVENGVIVSADIVQTS